MTESKYNPIEALLYGGPRARQKIQLPSITTIIDISRYEGSGLVYDRYRYTEELTVDEWLVFQFQCTHHTPGQDVV